VLCETDPQTTIWELLLPEEAKRLPAELVRIDAYLDEDRFIAPWRALFSTRLGRPSVPVDTLLRLLYLKHRYQLGYESLCREVADSLSWRRFCRIPLDRPVPPPTTLVKLVGRAGPQVIEEQNATPRCSASYVRTSCCAPGSCGWIPPWSRPTSTTRPTPTCSSTPSASWAGWSAA
jgi:IS5 family transposase